MKRVALATTWALVWSFALSARAEVNAEYRAAVRRMMDLTGSAQLGTQFGSAVVVSMSKAMRSARPDLPPRAFELLEQDLALIEESIEMRQAWAVALQPRLQSRLMERLVEEGMLPAEAAQSGSEETR